MKYYFIFITLCLIKTCSSFCAIPAFTERYFEQPIDHFNALASNDETFRQRYLINDTWWDSRRGPIFFYTGNEGDIENFWKNTGFVFEIAVRFKALIVFAEHRYYGKSLPFGADSFTPQNIGWLSIDQAMADYASLIVFFEDLLCVDVRCPVITFGGSYGGMLSAYMRYKYPNLVDGAIAASAPIFQVAGLQSGEQFFQAVTKDFRECEKPVEKAFATLDQWYREGSPGIAKIQETLGICRPVNNHKEYRHLLLWIRNAFVMAAMMDYPYPTDFMGKYPAYPVKEMCKRILAATDPVVGLRSALELTYNSLGTEQCFDTWKQFVECSDPTGCGMGPAADAWDYQCCTEINLEGGSNARSDMFPNLPFNQEMRDFYCMSTWKVRPRRDWLRTNFWGSSIHYASNTVFSNGDLDPWAQGGVLHNVSGAYSILIEGGAHHLDLRGQNPSDPYSVINARRFHQCMIQTWLDEATLSKRPALRGVLEDARSGKKSLTGKHYSKLLDRLGLGRPSHLQNNAV